MFTYMRLLNRGGLKIQVVSKKGGIFKPSDILNTFKYWWYLIRCGLYIQVVFELAWSLQVFLKYRWYLNTSYLRIEQAFKFSLSLN